MKDEVAAYEERNDALSKGKSVHHLVEQPDGRTRRFTPSRQVSWTGHNINTPEKAMQHLENAKKAGKMACDWGCTTKVQSRGCAIHAQVRWSR
jgi:hypothetical protein